MGGNKLSLPADKRILIIGGGYGGSTLGSKLLKENHPNFTVVDVREAMHHNIATGRASVQKGKQIYAPRHTLLSIVNYSVGLGLYHVYRSLRCRPVERSETATATGIRVYNIESRPRQKGLPWVTFGLRHPWACVGLI